MEQKTWRVETCERRKRKHTSKKHEDIRLKSTIFCFYPAAATPEAFLVGL